MFNNWRFSSCLLAALMVGAATVVSASSGSVARDAWLALPPPTANSRYCDPYTELFGDRDAIAGAALTFGRLRKLSRMDIWKTYRHQEERPFHRSGIPDGEFANYNPSFVRWASSTFIPARNDSGFRRKTQSRYDFCIAKDARSAWQALQVIKADTECRDLLVERFRRDSAHDRAAPTWKTWQRYCFADGEEKLPLSAFTSDAAKRAKFYTGDIGFWLRREIDGSRREFESGLKTLLRTYDSGWLARGDEPQSPIQADPSGRKDAHAALMRLRAPQLRVIRKLRQQRLQPALETCRTFQAQVLKWKQEVARWERGGRHQAADAANQEMMGWVRSQQDPMGDLAYARERVGEVVKEVRREGREGSMTSAEVSSFVERVEAECATPDLSE